ncbi:MAG: hypothetical protein ACKVS8_08140 [Phycisphaerales bacterium]
MDAPAPDQPVALRPPSRARRRAVWLTAVLALIAAGVGLWHSATRGVIARAIVASAVRAASGCETTVRAVHVRLFGAADMEGLSLRVPGVAGPAGEVLRAERVVAELDWSGWLRGVIVPTAIAVDRPVLRLSQSAEGTLNISAVPSGRGSGAGTAVVPRLSATAARVEVGEHDGAAFTLLTHVDVTASLAPNPARPDEYVVQMREIAPATMPEDAAIRFDGWVNLRAGEGHGTLSGMTLDRWTAERVPLSVRGAWQAFNMRGRILPTQFTYSRAGGVEATVGLGNVSMSIPGLGEVDAFGAGQPLNMHGVSGTVRFHYGGTLRPGGGIDATVTGKVEDLDCRVILAMDGLDPFWSGVSCQVWTDEFVIEKNPRLMPFLPELVRRRFTSFSGPTAKVVAYAMIRREGLPPVFSTEMARPWQVSGSVRFENGRAAFEHFPYPFFDLQGLITFDAEAVTIKGVSGRGLTGASLVANGRISVPDEGARAWFDVTVVDAPMDELLWAAIDRRGGLARAVLGAVSEEQARVLRSPEGATMRGPAMLENLLGADELARLKDGENSWRDGLVNTLFSAARHQQLVEDGLIMTPAQAALARSELERLLARRDSLLNAGPPGPGAVAADDGLVSAIAAARADLDRPEFAFLGRVKQLNVRVDYAPATHGHYDTTITMNFDGPGAGLVPDVFPMPLYAKELRIEVTDPAATFFADVGRGLRAGTAAVSGSINLTSPEKAAHTPTIRIEARDFLVDELLINAIPRRGLAGRAAKAGSDKGMSARAVLNALRVRGLVDCTAKIEPDATGAASMDIDVTLNGLLARPLPLRDDGEGVVISGLTGRVSVNDNEVRLDGVRGQVRSATDPAVVEIATPGFIGPPAIDTELVEIAGDRPGGIALDALVRTSDAGVEVDGRLKAARLDLAWPLEDAVAIVARDAGLRLSQLRQSRRPEGTFDADVRAAGDADGTVRVSLGVASAQGLAVNALGGRLAIDREAGDVRVDITSLPPTVAAAPAADAAPARDTIDAVVSFEGFRAGLMLAGEERVLVDLDGSVKLSDLGSVGASDTGASGEGMAAQGLGLAGPLRAAVRDGRFESAITHRVLRAAGLPGLVETMNALALRGVFDADVAASPRPGTEDALILSTAIRPRSLGLTQTATNARGESVARSVDMETVTGRIVIDDRTGRIEGLRLAKDSWSAGMDGALTLAAQGDEPGTPPWTLEAVVDLEGARLEPSLVALLPGPVVEALESGEIVVRNGFALQAGRLNLTGASPDQSRSIGAAAFEGTVAFSGLSAETGVSLAGAVGQVAVVATLAAGAERAEVSMDFDVPLIEAAGIPLTSAKARVLTGTAEHDVLADFVTGDCQGGRLSARAFVVRNGPEEAAASPRRYEATVQATGVLLADLLAELERRALRREQADLVGPLPEEALIGPSERVVESMRAARAMAAPGPGNNSRGRLDAELSLTGLLGIPSSKTGGGSVRVAGGGDVLASKFLTQMVEFSNLHLPLGDALDFGHGLFSISGDRVGFDYLTLLSSSVSLIGYGSITLPEMSLDLTFNSRGYAQVPLLSGAFEAARNELITTRVMGTLRAPAVSTEPFMGTRRMLDSLFGGGPRERTPDAERIDEAVRAERARWLRGPAARAGQ